MKNLFRSMGLSALVGIIVLTVTACGGAPPAAKPVSAQDVPLVKAPHQLYDASSQPAAAGQVKEIILNVEEKTLEIAPGVPYDAWTFGGSVPGPILRVRQGDEVKFTLVNHGKLQHSMDFHAAQTAWNVNYINVGPGEKYSYTWKANYPGIFMYHCGTAPVIAHIGSGMYGAIIVDPIDALPAAREYVIVQSEFYTGDAASDGIFHYDGTKANNIQPSYVVFNGYANQYKDNPLAANPGELIRLWVMNAGPSEFSAFHVVGAIFEKSYPDGNPKTVEHGRQTVTIPPGGGYMVELKIPDNGLYPVVTHSFAHPGKGALGLINVGGVKANLGGMSH
ncbi:MAG: multicopper oxidase domain-containing protein [Chloroflexi bacterium]|nr:multicopper oxidase domain-containing protein [Chloroflexota bacterium]